jgi:sphinganine-1-phosphate aldolase
MPKFLRFLNSKPFRRVEQATLLTLCLVGLNTLCVKGLEALLKDVIGIFRGLPFVETLLSVILDGEVKDAVSLLSGSSKDSAPPTEEQQLIPLPAEGIPSNVVVEILENLKNCENTAEEGKAFAYTYTTKRDMMDFAKSLSKAYSLFAESSQVSASGKNKEVMSHDDMLSEAWNIFMHSNGLNPMMYPSLRKFETEILSMSTWLFNGDINCAGSLTSGGTESILMAIKTYRDLAREKRPYISKPNMIVPTTIHPAFEKAAHYFSVEIIHVPLDSDMRVNMDLVEKAVNRNTILLVGSAPQYCHGVIDPIEALSELATAKGLPLHVDACFGGFMLPWMEKNGQQLPLWDFRVPGVTSISADIHKYGYSSKGASIVIYRSKDLRKYQYFAYSQWPGGLFASPSLAGSRPGGMIASAWSALVGMGQNGYKELCKQVMDTTQKLMDGVSKIDGIKVLTKPDMTALAIASDSSSVNILAVADIMEDQHGWKIERQQLPDTLHLSVLPAHSKNADVFLADLQKSVTYVKEHPECNSGGTTGVYGMVAKVPDKGIIDEFLKKFFNSLYSQDTGANLFESHMHSKGK